MCVRERGRGEGRERGELEERAPEKSSSLLSKNVWYTYTRDHHARA